MDAQLEGNTEQRLGNVRHLEQLQKMLESCVNTSAAAVICRAGDEGFSSIVHRSAHEAPSLEKKHTLQFSPSNVNA